MTDAPTDDLPELSLGAETAFPIVLKAREYWAKTPQTDPDAGSNPSDDNDIDVLEDTPGDPTYAELAQAIADLNEDERLDLIALIWVGRGDYGLAEWADARAAAGDIERRRAPRYVAGLPQGANYLEDGLALFGHSLEEYTEDH